MKNEKNTVDGYYFEDEEMYKAACNELEGVEYLKKRTNYSDPESVRNVYRTVIDKKLFKTPIGYEFLRELQNFLFNSEKIPVEEVEAIPVVTPLSAGKKKSFDMPKFKKKVDISSPYRTRFVNLLIWNIVMVILLILFMVVSNNSKNLNIMNYERRIKAEYTEKEDSLAKWESRLNEWEQQLESRTGEQK